MIKIILADDHKIMRQGLRTLIEKQKDMEIIAEADNGRDTVELANKLSPDVVVMDTIMPDLNGIEATRQIVANAPGIKIMALSMHSDKRYVVEMIKAGASGYMLKNSAFEELVNAIHSISTNQMYLSPTITTSILKEYVHDFSADNASSYSKLTAREREVLQLIAEGKKTREIAADLFVSVKTVETHRQQIMNKLDIHSIAGLTKFAIREGITCLED